jgi:hypothetical protein
MPHIQYNALDHVKDVPAGSSHSGLTSGSNQTGALVPAAIVGMFGRLPLGGWSYRAGMTCNWFGAALVRRVTGLEMLVDGVDGAVGGVVGVCSCL